MASQAVSNGATCAPPKPAPAEANAEVTLQALNAEYMKIKFNHRGVYDSQKDQLMAMLDVEQSEKQKKNAKTCDSIVRLKKVRARKDSAHERKRESQIRSARNKTISNTVEGKASAKLRKEKFTTSHPKAKLKVKRAKKTSTSNIFSSDL